MSQCVYHSTSNEGKHRSIVILQSVLFNTFRAFHISIIRSHEYKMRPQSLLLNQVRSLTFQECIGFCNCRQICFWRVSLHHCSLERPRLKLQQHSKSLDHPILFQQSVLLNVLEMCWVYYHEAVFSKITESCCHALCDSLGNKRQFMLNISMLHRLNSYSASHGN